MAPAPKRSSEEEEALLLDAAIKCIEKTSIMDFTMSALSKEAGISMGSVYKHIQSKEDVILALATQMKRALKNTFTEILSLPVSFPLRLIAMGMTNEASMACYKFGGQLAMLAANEAVLQRASPQWREKAITADMAIEHLVAQKMHEAVAAGELATTKAKVDNLVEELLIGSWSLQVGFLQVARQRYTRHLINKGIAMPFPLAVNDSIIQAKKRLLNTYPWAEPVTDEGIASVCQLLTARNLR